MNKQLIVVALFMSVGSSALAADQVEFTRDVVPILHDYCLGCHTADDGEGGLAVESYDALMAGGESGLAITAGEAESSRLVLMLSGKLDPLMPPEGEPRPDEAELALLEAWIEQGATGPQGDTPIRRELRVPEIEPTDRVVQPVTAIAISSATGHRAEARFGAVELVDRDGHSQLQIGEPGKVNSLQFSGDGSRLLVASGLTGSYGRAAIYATDSGELLTEMLGHRDILYAAKFSPDERLVATAGYDREVAIWDAETGALLRRLLGHNGAIFDLAFSPDGSVLVSASADETLKVWAVESGLRLDTLSQPEGEVFAVEITPDGKFVIAGSADNRLRIWKLISHTEPRINPLVGSRFVDESPLTSFALTPDGSALVVVSEAGNVKVVRTTDWRIVASLDPLGDAASDVACGNSESCAIALMSGELVTRELPQSDLREAARSQPLEHVYLTTDALAQLEEDSLSPSSADSSSSRLIPRGAMVSGKIISAGEVDQYDFDALAGEVWAIDVDAEKDSPLDPIVEVTDADGFPILQTRLQAVRDSYFTFRGKNSTQSDDFRLFAWEELHLDDYLYAAGEVTRLWMHPRGPDSGFNVYPGQGTRWTYFGTTHAAHALGEPAYVVRSLQRGEEPLANGLPVFDVYYQNDDDPMREVGKNSRLLFVAPANARYTIAVRDTRGDGGPAHRYRLKLRAADPDFQPAVTKIDKPLRRGSGREFVVRIDRRDGFDGPVTFEIDPLPDGLVTNSPLTIEAGQESAIGTIWANSAMPIWDGDLEPQLIARATVLGRKVERRAGSLGKLSLADPSQAIPSIQPIDHDVAADESWTLRVHRGETVSARVRVQRQDDFTNEVSFGKEFSGRNTTHGVYVDNIGLNGLLVRANESEREFFLTADPIAQPGTRSFFLTAEINGGVTTHPITVEVLP